MQIQRLACNLSTPTISLVCLPPLGAFEALTLWYVSNPGPFKIGCILLSAENMGPHWSNSFCIVSSYFVLVSLWFSPSLEGPPGGDHPHLNPR